MESHRVNSIISGRKPTVTLYTYINHHVGTPKQKQTSYYTVSDSCFCFSVFFGSGRKFDRYKDTFVRGEDVFGRRKDTSLN